MYRGGVTRRRRSLAPLLTSRLKKKNPVASELPHMVISLTGFMANTRLDPAKNMSDGNKSKQMKREFAAGSEEPPQSPELCRSEVFSSLNSSF